MILETLTTFRTADENIWEEYRNGTTAVTKFLLSKTDPITPILVTKVACTVLLTLEFIARYFFAPNKCRFLSQGLNVLQIICLLPAILFHGYSLFNVGKDARRLPFLASEILGYFLLLRVFLVFRLTKDFKTFHLFCIAIRKSSRELVLLLVIISIFVIIFSFGVFYAEQNQDTFLSIFDAFWWAVVTMTTVGYGDMFPVSNYGRFIGTLCALCGIMAIAMPIGVIGGHFSHYSRIFGQYERRQTTQRYKKNTTNTE